MHYSPKMLASRLVAAEMVAVPFAVEAAPRRLRFRLSGLNGKRKLGSDSRRYRDLQRREILLRKPAQKSEVSGEPREKSERVRGTSSPTLTCWPTARDEQQAVSIGYLKVS